MSNLWWLQPGWTDACCGRCGARIYPEGDPDWGWCWSCMQESQNELQQANEHWAEEERRYWAGQWAEQAAPWFDETHPMNRAGATP